MHSTDLSLAGECGMIMYFLIEAEVDVEMFLEGRVVIPPLGRHQKDKAKH